MRAIFVRHAEQVRRHPFDSQTEREEPGRTIERLITALSSIGRYDLMDRERIETLIEGICLRFALFRQERELPEPPGLDMPNKFIVVRSAVKPKEKSPEEKSKD